MRKRIALFILPLLLTIILTPILTFGIPDPSPADYVGSQVCTGCHSALNSEIVEKWQGSKHAELGDVENHTAHAYPLSRGIGCAGCHATNYDPETNTYNEPLVSCESCHGPGGDHIKGPSKENIGKSVSAQVCGQCHNRHGTSTTHVDPETGEPLGYPVGYTPDKPLEDFYLPASLDDEHSFWPTGHASYSHGEGGMQYPEYIQTPHSKALETIQESDHGADHCLLCHSEDYRRAPEDAKPTVETAQYSLTCVTCHDPHGETQNPKQLLSSNEEICLQCHAGSEPKPGEAIHHPTKFLMEGEGGIGVPDLPSVHAEKCVYCHMPAVGLDHLGNPTPGKSHTWRILEPEEAEEHDIHASSCTLCHGTDEDPLVLMHQPTLDQRYNDVAALATEVKAKLEGTEARLTTEMGKQLWTEAKMNYDFATEEPACFFHNYQYAKSLLYEASQRLDNAVSLQEASKDVQQYLDEISSLKSQATTLKNQVSAAEDKAEELEGELGTAESNLAKSESDLAAAQKSLTDSKADLDKAKADLTKSQSDLADANKQISDAKQLATTLQTKVTELEGRVTELEAAAVPTTTLYLYLVGGLIVGLIIGAAIAYALKQRRA